MEGWVDDGAIWDDTAFRKNVARIVRNQQRTQQEVLEAAGLSRSYLARAPSVGRSITGIIKLANQLDVTICELIDGAAGCPLRPGLASDRRT
jgi:transcriptional regulator with XRE-family HTH domain